MDRVGIASLVPVEFFGTRKLEFLPSGSLLQRFEVGYELVIVHGFLLYGRSSSVSHIIVKTEINFGKILILIKPHKRSSGHSGSLV